MKINKVTMTGADNSVHPADLLKISKQFPFVEWGILISRNSQGGKRFPSKEWMDGLTKVNDGSLLLACHVCGSYVKELLLGEQTLIDEIGDIWAHFQRVQINTHGYTHEYEPLGIKKLRELNKEIIFQFDGVNKKILDTAIALEVNCSTLFDMSHGYGLLPEQWPTPIDGVRCGYAGGLSPDNIKEQILLIQSKVGDYELWIDMETKVRSRGDLQFDLDKVVSVLQSCVETGLIKS